MRGFVPIEIHERLEDMRKRREQEIARSKNETEYWNRLQIKAWELEER